MKITYIRRGGWMPPSDRELLTIQDDGAFVMWRSVNTLICGRFAGQLKSDQWRTLQQEGVAAKQAGPVTRSILPDSAIETIQVDDILAKMGHTDTLEGSWGVLADHLRTLLTDLQDAPQAVVALEVAPQGASARLVHRGSQPLSLDLTGLTVRVILWEGYYEQRGSWQWAAPGEWGRVDANPGWSLNLNFQHGLAPGKDQVVHTYVTFSVFDRDGLVNVSLVDAPLLPLTHQA